MFQNIDFLYDIRFMPVISSSLQYKNPSKYPKVTNISSKFYEGFGYDLY